MVTWFSTRSAGMSLARPLKGGEPASDLHFVASAMIECFERPRRDEAVLTHGAIEFRPLCGSLNGHLFAAVADLHPANTASG
jgi:hypothetical protein